MGWFNHLTSYLICFFYAAFFAQGFCGESQRPLSTIEKVLCAAVAGATGAFAGNPGDLAMVRMQAVAGFPGGRWVAVDDGKVTSRGVGGW